ncbi:hypothetical protein GCM10027288_38080 [Bordetella tumbae]
MGVSFASSNGLRETAALSFGTARACRYHIFLSSRILPAAAIYPQPIANRISIRALIQHPTPA